MKYAERPVWAQRCRPLRADGVDPELLLAAGEVDTAEGAALLAEGVALLCSIRDRHLQ